MSFILISDCGATTCQSAIISKKDGSLVARSKTSGYNPHSSSIIDFPRLDGEKEYIEQVYFYVSGYKPTFQSTIRDQILLQFPTSKIHVNSDLKAAALSLSAEEQAYIHVIGTGSAVNFWNGRAFTNPKINLGYLWEDYASGFDMGKTMIQWWSEQKLSEHENQILEDHLGSLGTFIQKVYRGNSKLLLAEASPIIQELSNETRKKIINERLELYFTRNIDIFANSFVHHFTGSLADALRQTITRKMNERDVSLGTIQKDSMEGLISYYQHKITKS